MSYRIKSREPRPRVYAETHANGETAIRQYRAKPEMEGVSTNGDECSHVAMGIGTMAKRATLKKGRDSQNV